MEYNSIEKIILNVAAHGILVSKATKEIYKLHLQEKLQLIETFRTDLISEGFELLADEYFEVAEELTKELKKLE